ncbi:MAG: VOC family protein [Ktedonobacterales bacterium]
MITGLIRVTILVHNQDEALAFYTEKLGLEKREDMTFGPGVRWLTVAPRDQRDIEIVLQKPDPAMHGEQGASAMLTHVGHGATWVFATDDCQADYEALSARGVTFQSPPADQPYGVEAVFEDLYGNSFSLLQPARG